MKLRRNVLVSSIISVALLSGIPVLAQDSLSAGELLQTRHVRLAAPTVAPGWLTGHLIGVDSSVFIIQTIRARPWEIPRDRVTAIQVGKGRDRTESVLRGMGIGALVGGGALLAWELLIYGQGEMFGFVAFVIGIPVGGLSGGIVGALQNEFEWVDVEVRPAP